MAEFDATEQWTAWIAHTFREGAMDRINELPDDGSDEAHLAELFAAEGDDEVGDDLRGEPSLQCLAPFCPQP